MEDSIHARSHDLALCGFTKDPISKWPPNHGWTNIWNVGGISCPQCLKLVAQLHQKEADRQAAILPIMHQTNTL